MDDPSKMKLFFFGGRDSNPGFSEGKKSVGDRVDTDFGIVGQFS